MSYKIKEIYYTLQGEGHHTGRPAVFCRFSGCNLWSGRELDRHKAICQFCDTDFVGNDGPNGGTYTASQLAAVIKGLWPDQYSINPYIVCTGGEPLLQLDKELIGVFHNEDMIVAIETNGTIIPPAGIDWITVSPKAKSEIRLTKGNEIKLVWPQLHIHPVDFGKLDFEFFYLQPLDDENRVNNTKLCIDFCLKNPQWFLSLQTHKYLNIP